MFATALLTATLAAPVPKALKAAPLDGRWLRVEVTQDGKTEVDKGEEVWEISGERLVPYRMGVNSSTVTNSTSTLKLPDGITGNTVDGGCTYHGEEGDRVAPVSRGLFQLDGDTLTMCFSRSAERPKSLTPAKGEYRMVFTRVKDEPKK